MVKKLSFLILLVALTAIADGQSSMFRGNPAHVCNDTGFGGQIFNHVKWTFATGAPIRGTVATGTKFIYCGSTDGYLYALNKASGIIGWKFPCGSAISSSPACADGLVYITTRQQKLLALNAATGQLKWTQTIGTDKPYDWGFDYYYPSPTITGDSLLVASSDGTLLCLDKWTGHIFWRWRTTHSIRASPAVLHGRIFIGDTFGDMHALDESNGTGLWTFHTAGAAFDNDTIGFDRKAIISSAAVDGDNVVFGGRDGFLYCVNADKGTLRWSFDHQVSWVISSPSIVNHMVITGTSDGHFVQAVDITTGKELWRTYGSAPLWSSPLVVGDHVYIAGNEGVLYCLDLLTGEKVAHPFSVNARIFTSPVLDGQSLYMGADDGVLYCLGPRAITAAVNHYVYWETQRGSMFLRGGTDQALKDFLAHKGYQVTGALEISTLVSARRDSGKGQVLVLISSKLPPAFVQTDSANVLNTFMRSGGIVVDPGGIALMCNLDDSLRFRGFDFKRCDTILGLPFRYNDLRSFGGFFSATATATGKKMGMKDHWTATCPVDPTAVDIILGLDEKGRASAWVKKIGKGYYVQLWVDQQFPEDYDFVDEVIMHVENLPGS